jgi:hypothetical protein
MEQHRIVGALLTILGVTFIVIGFVRVSDSRMLAETIAYIVSGGIGGVAMLGSGLVLLTCAQLRDRWDTIDRTAIERNHGTPHG